MFYRFNNDDIKNQIMGNSCAKLLFPKNKGMATAQMINIHENITLSKVSYYCKDDICIENNLQDHKRLCLNILLNGDMLIDEKISKEEKHLQASYSSIHVAREMKGDAYLRKNQKIDMLSVFIDTDFAEELFPNLDDLTFTKTLKYTQTSVKADALAKEIYNFLPNSKMQMLYLQSKVLELLYCEFLFLDVDMQKDKTIFSTYDKNAIKKARQIILSSFKNPPSTKELSKMVHLNEFKLKLGFKTFYGNSIYKTLLHHKLDKAKQMLQSQDINVSEAAKMCGYNHPSSFSLAFKKHFGINAKDISKEH